MNNPAAYEFPDGSEKKEVKIGKWFISLEGEMTHEFYTIYPEMLTQDDLILHISGKTWFESADFFPAYFQALVNAGIQEVKFKSFY